MVSSTYNVYSANDQHVRIIRTSDPDHVFDPGSEEINEYLIDLDPDDPGATENPDYVIEDAIRDKRGNLVQVINGLGTIQQTEYDGVGRAILQTADYGGENLLTSTTFDAYGNVAETENASDLVTEFVYEPSGTGFLYEQTIAAGAGASLEATTRFQYDISGRQVAVIAPKPNGSVDTARTTTTEYEEACCGQFVGTKDPLGHGHVQRSNSIGQGIYSATIANYDSHSDPKNPDDANTLSESTSRYRPDGRMEFQTSWTTAISSTIGNTPPPIAGVDNYDETTGPAANLGVTTRYLYDYDLTDDAGLDSSSGESFDNLSGSTVNVSLSEALSKLADTTANGGARIVFVENMVGNATAVVSPDEKTVQFSISDGLGRTVMSGLLSGPAAPQWATANEPDTPNELLTWTCVLYDQVYDDNGENRVETITVDQDGYTRKSRANGLGWAIATFDELDNETTTTYDSGGNQRTVATTGQTITYQYDALSRNTITTDNTLSTSTETTYDDTGRIYQQEDAKGNFMTYASYDVLDRPLEIEDRLQQSTYRAYNTVASGDDFKDTITDAEGEATTYTMDILGRRKYVDLEDGQRTEFVYDAAGRQSEIVYESGARRVYTYAQPSGVLEKIEYYDVNGTTLLGSDEFEYNDVLQRTAAKQYDGQQTLLHSVSWEYTLRGQVFKETTAYQSQNYVVEHRYDARGRLERLIHPSTRDVEYTYTPQSLVETIDWNGNQIEERVYNNRQQLTDVYRPSQNSPLSEETRTFTGSRLMSIANTATNKPNFGTISYTYDANNNKTAETFTDNTLLDDYSFTIDGTTGYDAEDRFLEFDRQGFSDATFDRSTPSGASGSIGNIISISGGDYTGTRSFTDVHQLTGAGFGSTQVFDDDGNLTTSHVGTTFDWNSAAGRLESVTVPSTPSHGTAGTHTYGYDATGRRAWKLVGSTKTVFIYSGPNCIAEYVAGTAATTPGNEYVYADGIDSLAMLVYNNNAVRLNVLRNQQWSVVGLLASDTGEMKELYGYNVFGDRKIMTATGTGRSASSYKNPYGYTSRAHDPETGLMYFRARYYDGATGEFISPDPSGYVDGMSLFRAYFVINAVDPLGLKWWRADMVAKSYINGVSVVGDFFPEEPLPGQLFVPPSVQTGLPILAGATARLILFGIATDLAFRENPLTDAKDLVYRLYTRVDVRFCCTGNTVAQFTSATDKDGGREAPFIFGSINLARDVGNNLPVVRRGGPNLIIASWRGWGKPNPIVEPSFQVITPRTSVNIWHKTEVWMWCSGGMGKYRIVSFFGSSFPSHRIWVNGGIPKRTITQGALSELWSPQPGRPSFVK